MLGKEYWPGEATHQNGFILLQIRRIPIGTNTRVLPSASQESKSNADLQGLKNEIIGEVKNELHSFARQLMQFMGQCQPINSASSESESMATSKGTTINPPPLPVPPPPPPTLSASGIDRERIGGVSVTYGASATAGFSLSAPRQQR